MDGGERQKELLRSHPLDRGKRFCLVWLPLAYGACTTINHESIDGSEINKAQNMFTLLGQPRYRYIFSQCDEKLVFPDQSRRRSKKGFFFFMSIDRWPLKAATRRVVASSHSFARSRPLRPSYVRTCGEKKERKEAQMLEASPKTHTNEQTTVIYPNRRLPKNEGNFSPGIIFLSTEKKVEKSDDRKKVPSLITRRRVF